MAANPTPDQPDPAAASWQAERESPDAKVDPKVLEDVLKATLSAASEGEPIAAEEMAALQAVARQYPDEPFSLDPIAVSLVAAMLRVRLPRAMSGQPPDPMTREIASELCDAPAARSRMEHLWRQLLESRS